MTTSIPSAQEGPPERRLIVDTMHTPNTARIARRVWLWEDMESWEPIVRELMQPQVSEGVIKQFRAQGREYVVGDDLSWLDEIVQEVNGYESDMKRNLAGRLHERFDAIRAFHGTRPIDTDCYYAEGLKVLDRTELVAWCEEIFLSDPFEGMDRSTVLAAIEQIKPDGRAGRLCVEASSELLEQHCGHYMLYGSEAVLGVAATLGVRSQYRQFAKERGFPTVFVCDVPLELIDHRQLEDFAGQAIEAIFTRIIDANYRHPPRGRGSGIELRHALAADCIVTHYHPARIRDPLGP
jgi:hypothetical protein